MENQRGEQGNLLFIPFLFSRNRKKDFSRDKGKYQQKNISWKQSNYLKTGEV